MSRIRFKCRECEQVLEVTDDLAGRKIKCRYCDVAQIVPRPKTTPPQKPAVQVQHVAEIRTESGSRWAKNILILSVAFVLLVPFVFCIGGYLLLSIIPFKQTSASQDGAVPPAPWQTNPEKQASQTATSITKAQFRAEVRRWGWSGENGRGGRDGYVPGPPQNIPRGVYVAPNILHPSRQYDVRARLAFSRFKAAFGPPSHVGVEGQIKILSWRCLDGTVDVICKDTGDADSVELIGIDET